MTGAGGSGGRGIVFRMNEDGTGFSIMHSFTFATGDGYGPRGELLTLVGNTLYGITYQGGALGPGTVFRINTDGSGYGLVHSFANSPTDEPIRRQQRPAGGRFDFYGMTASGGADALGAVFGMNIDGSGYEVLHSFAGGSLDGSNPFGTLIEFNGLLYGSTSGGGSANDGILFSIAVPEPSSLVFVAAAGAEPPPPGGG